MLKISVLLLATILTTLAAPSVAKEEKETIFICNPYTNDNFLKLIPKIPMFEKPLATSKRIAQIPDNSTVEIGPGHSSIIDRAGTEWISIYYDGNLGYINKIFYTNETCLKRSRQ